MRRVMAALSEKGWLDYDARWGVVCEQINRGRVMYALDFYEVRFLREVTAGLA